MRYGKYGTSHLLLRWGLGLTFIWIGVEMLRTPGSWIGYLPTVIPFALSKESAIQLVATSDIVIGTLFLISKLPRLTAAAASGHLAGLLIVNGIDAVLIRDVGLFGTALSLLFWPQHGNRRHHRFQRFKFWKRKPTYDAEV